MGLTAETHYPYSSQRLFSAEKLSDFLMVLNRARIVGVTGGEIGRNKQGIKDPPKCASARGMAGLLM